MVKRCEDYERVYFSVADGLLESFLDKRAFERSLVLNALFQPAILIPDVFFFNSLGVERHVLESSRQSFLEACIASGVAIPAFREPTCSSFVGALEILRGGGDPNRAIKKLRDPRSNDRLANRLQVAANASGFLVAYWPKRNMGEQFDQVIKQYLACRKPPQVDASFGINQDDLDRLWKLTEPWRLDCVDEAREKTLQIDGGGLRRGELVNAVGRNLGLPPGYQAKDIEELLALPKSPDEKQALGVFLRWICELYQYNQAVEFGTTLNFPSYRPMSGVMTWNVLPKAPPLIDLLSIRTIQTTVSFPPMKVLLKISPTELLRVRNEQGPAYFAALKDWQCEPNDTKEAEVLRNLEQYSKEIMKLAKREQNLLSAVLDVVVGAQTTLSRQLLGSLLVSGGVAVSIYKPWVVLFYVLQKAGYAIYCWGAHRAVDTPIQFTAPDDRAKIPPEVNFPAAKYIAK